MSAPRTIPLFAACLLVAGCLEPGPDPRTTRWAEVDPDLRVENTVEGAWASDDAWRVEEVLSLGAEPGELDQFGDISGIDVDRDGNVYVADKQAQEIRVFDASGVPVRTIGQAGAGPGEFGGNIGGVFVIGDELVVPDVANQRISRFGLDGVFIGSERVSADRGVPLRWDVADGRLVAQRRTVVPGDEEVTSGDRIVSLTQPEDTLLMLPQGQTVQITGGIPQIRQFEAEPVWDSTYDGRLVTAMRDEWRFEARGRDGAIQWVATLPHSRDRVSNADRESVRESLRTMYDRQGVPPEARDAVVRRMEFAEYLPALTSVTFGPEGSLWVQQFVAPSNASGERTRVLAEDMGSTRWSVFDASGVYLGDVSFPVDFEPVQAVEDRFYGIGHDEFDVQSVKAYRVVTQ